MAGNGSPGYSGDSRSATEAQLSRPRGVAVDSRGNLFIADWNNHRIRKVDTSGTITTVAGNGSAGSGDGPSATAAKLNFPTGVAVDSSGNLFIADQYNHRIRKVDTSGAISTVAGDGNAGFSDDPSATATQLNSPTGVAVDSSGNLFIADSNNNRIRKVDTSGTISTVAGDGRAGSIGDNGGATAAQLNTPFGVAVDSSGNLFIADHRNHRIRKVSTSGTITTVAGNGIQGYNRDDISATAAQLNTPSGVAVDSSGNLFIADYNNHRIRKVDTSGTITTVAGTGTAGFSGDGASATAAQLNAPIGVAVDRSGNLFIADSNNNRIRKVDTSGTITTVAGDGSPGDGGDNGSATAAQLNYPIGVAVDSSGNLFIADRYNHRIRKVDTSGTITTVAGDGSWGYNRDDISATAAWLSVPSGVAVDSSGNLFIADQGNHRIRKVDTSGTISTVAGNGIMGFSDDPSATATQLNYPSGVVVDSSGNLFIADRYNHRIRKVDTSGTITTVAGDGSVGSGDGRSATTAQLNYPSGVAVDSSGNLFIADSNNNRIRKVDTSGTISTVAGEGSRGFRGDGESATEAQLNSPFGVAVDSSGNLFIADTDNDRIRMVDADVAPLAPSNVTALAGDGEAQVSWTPPVNNNGSAITGYTVYAYAPGTTSPALGQCSTPVVTAPATAATTCAVGNLTNGTAYEFTVVANNAAGPGAASAPSAKATPLAGLTLTSPASASASATVGVPFNLLLSASGGSGNYSFALQSGTLPAGLSLNGAAITGTPTAATTAPVRITVRLTDTGNSNSATNTKDAPIDFTVAKGRQTIQFTSTVPTGAKVGGSYTVAAKGGASDNAVTFAIDASASSVCSITGSTVSFNAKGNCVVTAGQLGNANYEDATGPTPQTIAVGQAGTGVVVTSSANPSKPGDEVSFTVTVSPDPTKSASVMSKAAPVPTGTITVTDNGTTLGTATLVNGSATVTVKTLTTPGDHAIVASYSGDANNAAAQSAAFTQTVAAVSFTPVPLFGEWWEKLLLSVMLVGMSALLLRMRRAA